MGNLLKLAEDALWLGVAHPPYIRTATTQNSPHCSSMARYRLPGFALPFLAFSLVLIVPTLIWLSFTSSPAPTDDARTAVSLNQLYAVGSELEGDVIMPKLPNATAK